jgi:hypothetical protein
LRSYRVWKIDFEDSDMSLAISKSTVRGGHSAAVRIELHTDGRTLRPSHTASDYLIFREPVSIPPGFARLVITIDGVPLESTLKIPAQKMPSDEVSVEIIKPALPIEPQ